MLVLKFGGAALADAPKIRAVVDCVRAWESERPVVVVSALFGITDRLVEAVDAALAGEHERVDALHRELAERHRDVLRELVPDDDASLAEVEAHQDDLLADLAGVLRALTVLGEATPRSRAHVVSMGERLSSRLVAAAHRSAGTSAEPVDGEEVIQTEGGFVDAFPRPTATRAAARERLLPLLDAGVVPVVMGFVGTDENGLTTSLGRGGTDLTASLIGAALDVTEVRFMKEVDGILSADPRRVPTARRLERLSYDEVAELSYFGAKVLHPVAIQPLREKGIPAAIRDVRDPEAPGTRVTARVADVRPGPRALTTIADVSLLSLGGGGLQGGVGFAGRVFSALARRKVNVLMISQGSSEQDLSLVIPGHSTAEATRCLEEELELELLKRRVDPIRITDDVAAIAVVGEGMRGLPGIAGRIFTSLGEADVNVVLIAQGSSERNVSFLVERADLDRALERLHESLGLGAT